MNAANELITLVDDLAAHWTEPTLEILKNAGLRTISVDMEIKTWRLLREVLSRELDWRRAFQVSTLVSMSALMERVLRKAALLIAQKLTPGVYTFDFEKRVVRSASTRRSTDLERRLYARIVRQPALHAAFKPPTRTDVRPRLQVSAVD